MSHKRQTYNVNNGEKVVVTTYEFPRKPEPRSFGKFLYDSNAGSFLGRTPKSWGQLMVFYIIFYIVLSSLFAICLQGLFATLSDEYPKWQLDESVIGTSPGMSFRPISESDDRNTIIRYKASSEKDVKQWVNQINTFLEPYINTTAPIGTNRVPCDFDKPPQQNQVCKFEIDSEFGDCLENSSFGFNTAAPCVFLKLNKIYKWVPEYYNNIENLPDDMPIDLKNHIIGLNNTSERNQIWVSCRGRHNDTVQDISYPASRGFPGYFYPFMSLKGYQSPLVPVQIRLKPNQITENNLVQIECRAWAKNIVFSGSMRDRRGSVLIELAIEK